MVIKMKDNYIQNNIQFIDSLEFWVSNGKSFIKSYLQPLNFNVIGTRFNKERTRVQYLLLNNIISRDNLEIGFEIENRSYIKNREHQFIIVTSSISSKDLEFHSKHQQHGDFIQNITFFCKDIVLAYNKSIEGGANSILKPIVEKFNDDRDLVHRAVIESPFKDLNHTFINREINSIQQSNSNGPLSLFPQFNALSDLEAFKVDCRSLLFDSLKLHGVTGSLDHIATCVKSGEMNGFVQWYHKCLNFKLLSDSVSDGDNLENELILDKNFYVISKKDFKYTKKENIGLKMAVLSNQPSNTLHYKTPPIQFVISEAIEGGEGQIEQFIHYFNGSGVQHLAFNSSDIFKAVENAKSQKLEFVYIPESYYTKLDERLKHVFPNGITKELKDDLMKYKILIDSDSEQILNSSKDIGYIKQIFTKYISDSPTIFFELIERSNALGFGKGNIIALFESLEKESESKIITTNK